MDGPQNLLPAPALLMRISMAPKRSRVRSTTRRRSRSMVMSPGVMRESGAAARRKPSALRAVSERLAPEEANSRAQAAPIPSEAPVMRTTLPSIRMGQTVPELIKRFEAELGPLPAPPSPPPWVKNEFSAEFYTRLLFSCLAEADWLD